MGVKVNESGTIKNLALDRDEVETLRVHLTIPAFTIPAKSKYVRAADLGITQCWHTTKYSTDSSSIKSPPILTSGNTSNSSYTWSDIPDECKVVLARGQFNFRLTVPCEFKQYTSSTARNTNFMNGFPNANKDNSWSGKTNVALRNASTSTWQNTAEIQLVLIIEEDGINYRIEAALIRTNQINETNALNDKYGRNFDSTLSSYFPYTVYFSGYDNDDYLVKKTPYNEVHYSVPTAPIIAK